MTNDAFDVLGNPYGTDTWSNADAGTSCGWSSFDSYSPTFNTGSCFDSWPHTDY